MKPYSSYFSYYVVKRKFQNKSYSYIFITNIMMIIIIIIFILIIYQLMLCAINRIFNYIELTRILAKS